MEGGGCITPWPRVQGLASAKVRLDRSLSPPLFSLNQSLGQRPSNLHQYDLTAVNISYKDLLQDMRVQSIGNKLPAFLPNGACWSVRTQVWGRVSGWPCHTHQRWPKSRSRTINSERLHLPDWFVTCRMLGVIYD